MNNNPKSARPSWPWIQMSCFLIGLYAYIWTSNQSSIKAVELPPAPEISNPKWAEMSVRMDQAIQEFGGDVGIYIKDLKTGQTYEHNADGVFVSASLIKLPIMMAAYQAIEDGALSLDERIKYKRSFRRGGSGFLKWSRPGASYTVAYLLHAMITKSDNTATAIMINRLGPAYLSKTFKTFGLETTNFSLKGMSLADTLDPDQDNHTSPREMGDLLEKIYRHEIVRDGLCDLMLQTLKGANARSRLKTYLPSNWQLARKTGLLRKYCHDVGIVFAPEGDYIICVLTGHNSTYRQAKKFIASVGKTAFQYFGNS